VKRASRGDGRHTLQPDPTFVLEGTSPIPVRRETARMLCRLFDEAGCSSHTGQGGTLWVIREHCWDNAIQHEVNGAPGTGFFVQRIR
jgi:hypothetical protein